MKEVKGKRKRTWNWARGRGIENSKERVREE